MTRSSQSTPIRGRAILAAAIVAVLFWTQPVRAEPVFPIGSRIGMVPPPGMSLSQTFAGFEDASDNAAILLATFPGDAFATLDKSMVPSALQKQGIEKREPFQAAAGNGFLLTGEHPPFREWMLIAPAGNVTALVTVRTPLQDNKYTDQAVRTALATLAVRASIPDAERLSLLPFTVGNLAGFKIEDVLPGRALMLVHLTAATPSADKNAPDKKSAGAVSAAAGSTDVEGHPIDARLLIAALQGGPTDAKDDDLFARTIFNQIGGISDVRVQDAEPLRLSGQSGYETLAKAKDAEGKTDLMVVQWLRFGSGGYMQMVGTARADAWPDVFMRMRTVRDSIGSR
ncbi:MAG TPA: hypothetical protein VMC05_05570 [Xanthobacteraceae bacterium]|nr:hypothetical protein [Xanthobacteraceae bacterium]